MSPVTPRTSAKPPWARGTRSRRGSWTFPRCREQFPSRWSVYFAADDADATAAQAVALGGSVVAAPQDSPFGRLATLADPTGATFKIQAVGTTSG